MKNSLTICITIGFALFLDWNPALAAEPPVVGIAVTPKNFPKHSGDDFTEAYSEASNIANAGVLIVQWGDRDPIGSCRFAIDQCRKHNMVPVIGLSPTSLDKNRKELDIPADLRRAQAGRISFSNPAIRKRFVADSIAIAGLKPKYLCLATEINFLAIHRLDEFLHFVTLYREAYAAVKKVSPKCKVFVSFQWEWMRIIDSKEIDKVAEHTKVVDIFRPSLDVVGMTTYPSPFHKSPADLPADYYSWMKQHTRPTDTIAFMEVGWPTAGSGSPVEQAEFIHRFPPLVKGLKVEMVAWSLLHDVKLPPFPDDLATTGLRTTSGQSKAGEKVFREIGKHWNAP